MREARGRRQPKPLQKGSFVSYLDLPDGFPDFIRDHLKLYVESDGDQGHMWDVPGLGSFPTLLLTTQGRKSGQSRVRPLIYGERDGLYVVVASKGGSPTHPLWYLNLVNEPSVDVQVAKNKFRARARTAEGEERSALWELMADLYSPYNDYQESAGSREIPVVVLERLSE